MSPTPHAAAQAARTLLAGQGSASLGTAFGSVTLAVLHAGLDSGEVVVLLSRGQVQGLGRPGYGTGGGSGAGSGHGAPRHRVVVLDIRSFAPLPDITLLRAHLSTAGWARPATPEERSAGLIALVRARGLDDAAGAPVICGWATHAVLVVEPAECEVHLPEGCHRIDINEVLLSEPDPLAAQEGSTIERLNTAYAGQLLTMVRRPGCGHQSGSASDPELSRSESIRVVGVDRHGVTLLGRLTDGSGSFGRLPFPAPVESSAEALHSVADLIHRHARCCRS